MRHQRKNSPWNYLLLAILAPGSLMAACNLEHADVPPPLVSMDDRSILSTAVHYRDSPAFVQLNDTVYASALGGGAFINVYVTAHAFAAYATVEPDAKGTGVVLPEGAIIVREVLDAAGNVTKLTLMAKGPDGYNPALGDYWFAVTEPDGTPVVEGGVELVGVLAQCHACHDERSRDDFLFGVPADNRKGVGEPSSPSRGGGGAGRLPPTSPPPPPTPAPPGKVCGDFVCELGESCVSCPYDCGRCEDGDRQRIRPMVY